MRIDQLIRSLPAELGAAAQAYADAGIAVFPCVPGGKTPLTEHGFHAASTDPGQVRRWWAWQPQANIGIATGHGIDILDIDVHPTGNGYPVLRHLHQAGLTAGWALTVRTPSGGLHLYFPSDPAVPRRSWGRGRAHVDFRGTGGYVIAPPSRILVGGQLCGYRVVAVGGHPGPVRAETIKRLLTPAPRPLAGPARPIGQDRAERGRHLAHWLGQVPEGNRNAGLFWAACRLAELGFDEAETRQVLHDPAHATGLDDREIDATLRSAHRTVGLSTPDPAVAATATARSSWGRL